jgi:biopolymer transport protein ExbD
MAWLRKRREEPKVDLTSMVDVVFLLLIFFMISTTFVANPGLTIKLPESGAKRSASEPKEVKVYLSAAGEISLGDQRVTLAELRQRLQGYGSEGAQMTFVLYADAQSRHGRVVELMDAARAAGFAKLAIATEPKEEQ